MKLGLPQSRKYLDEHELPKFVLRLTKLNFLFLMRSLRAHRMRFCFTMLLKAEGLR